MSNDTNVECGNCENLLDELQDMRQKRDYWHNLAKPNEVTYEQARAQRDDEVLKAERDAIKADVEAICVFGNKGGDLIRDCVLRIIEKRGES